MLLFLYSSDSSKFENTENSDYQVDDSCSDITDCPYISIDSALIDEIIKDDNIEQEFRDVLTNLVKKVHDNTILCQKKLTRKRSVNSNSWAKNIRKETYQSGQRHINSKGKVIEAKAINIKKNCMATCKFKCATKINHTVQEKIFLDFYLQSEWKTFIHQGNHCSLFCKL